MYSRRFRIKGLSHKICFRGVLGEKGKSPVGSVVQWFSGMLFCCAGSALWLLKLFGVKINRRRFNKDEEGRKGNGLVWGQG
jgi:hypothetical protein